MGLTVPGFGETRVDVRVEAKFYLLQEGSRAVRGV